MMPWKRADALRKEIEDLTARVRRLEQLHLLNAGIGSAAIEHLER